MTVNFDNLRKQAAYSYASLCEKLNDAIKQAKKDGYQSEHVPIDPDFIKEDMDDLRMQIAIICCCYDEQSGLKSVGHDLEIPIFNKKEL